MLKRVPVCVAVAVCLFAAVPAQADSPFDGTWTIDQAKTKIDPKPIVLSLRSGTWRCSTCEPAYSLNADGAFHPVQRDYIDAQRIVVVSPRVVRSETRREGKLLGGSTWTVSRDGRTMASQWWNVDNAEGKRMTGTAHYVRLGKAPRGLHAVNGSWRQDAVQNADAAAVAMTFAVDGDRVTVRQPTGEHATMMLGGPKVKIEGDPVDTYLSARRIDAGALEFTGYLGDKVTGTEVIRVNADGSMTITSRSPAGLVNENTARKQ